MFDERSFIAGLESTSADELADVLRRPTIEEERALRAYFGDERYQRLHAIALRSSISRGTRKPKGKVVVIHGLMGSDLTSFSSAGDEDHLWVKVFRLITGQFSRLRLEDDGRSGKFDIRATGIMKRYYGELLLSLSQYWDVHAFWFDWRKDLNIAADELAAKISGWFGEQEPFHIVAHSMGGLVARTFIKNHRKRWDAMRSSAKHGGQATGRLIMLGTPNHGSFVVPQIITGLEPIIRKIALLDATNKLSDLVQIANTFVGTYQMLPSPLVIPKAEALYKAETYGDLKVAQRHLDTARKHHKELSDVVDLERMICIAGTDQPTLSNINDFGKLHRSESYELTLDGDGRVPHLLSRLEKDGQPVPTYYIDEAHGNLPTNSRVIALLNELLETGVTSGLPDHPPARPAAETKAAKEALRQEFMQQQQAEIEQVQSFTLRMKSKRAVAASTAMVSADERRIEEMLTRGFLGSGGEEKRRVSAPTTRPFVPRLEIALVHGGIEDIDHNPEYKKARAQGTRLIDALAVGHYKGVKPTAAELLLDVAISRKLPGKVSNGDYLQEADLIVTQYSERGIIRGELGQPFFLLDPRASNERVLAIAGMGDPGRFGASELTVLARELCWSLGRMGKRHLATVLIGTGFGGLSPRDAITSWLRGAANALAGSAVDAERHLTRITFVEYDPRKIEDIDDAIHEVKKSMEAGHKLEIVYQDISAELEKKLPQLIRDWEDREWHRAREKRRRKDDNGAHQFMEVRSSRPLPTRITVSLDRKSKSYHFGAITEQASIPEREIALDPELVMRANDELAAESTPGGQFDRGQFMEQLLLPDDLRGLIYTEAPLVMLLDATTARIHWEMVAQTGLSSSELKSDQVEKFEEVVDQFIGTSRSFTRQLRSLFAPPPEPPPPPRRVLKVLVVADPAEDARLPGAEEEGVEVADLFESFNKIYEEACDNRVEVTRLFGPREATRTNVLRHLMLRSYDILHFAGHCLYDAEDPGSSGWIFTGSERLSAKELNRIDRIPKFVFSNACESGITPDRAELRTADLAPSFAEAFFARGVSNFVCTAWPIDDLAARMFAKRLYSCLLGLRESATAPNTYEREESLEPIMHIAMREARRDIGATPFGARTWGAYQHYGNPYLQFFDQTALSLAGGARSSNGHHASTHGSQAAAKKPRQRSATKSRSAKKR